MSQQPREPAVAESYPTFWDELPRTPAFSAAPPDDAYSEFVNLIEEELPAELQPDAE
jgi:hypothetical protein